MAARLSSTPSSSAAGRKRPAALELRAVTKRFGSQTALDDVELTLAAGEVHALLGQNGSGKSTLIKTLAGFHAPEAEAHAAVDGQPLDLGSATGAHAAGIRFVHQDLALIGDLDVVDNLALGGHYAGRRWLADKRERHAAQQLLDGLGIEIDARRAVRDLSPSQRTMVAVARALRDGEGAAHLLVLDEVSAALPATEVEQIFALVRRIRDRGGTVLYVTHRLEEVFALADRVTVLRDGRNVATTELAGLNHDGLVELIVGRRVEELYPTASQPRGDVVLSASGIRGAVADDVDLTLHRGEIVGLAGLAGSGRDELPYLLFGAKPWAAGRLAVKGRERRRMIPSTAIDLGLALIPADRLGRASTPRLSLRENITLPRIPSGRARFVAERAERREAIGWLRRLDVKPLDAEAPLATLSGGNQQKVVLARWFRCEPAVLLLDDPTQGVDVGSKAAIYAELAEAAGNGLAVLIASTDHEELAAICDRVLVMRAGKVAAELYGERLAADTISEQVLVSGSPNPIPEMCT